VLRRTFLLCVCHRPSVIWGTFLCEGSLGEEDVRRGVAAAFGIVPDDLTVVASLLDLTTAMPFVVLRPVGGDFACAGGIVDEVHLPGARSDILVRFAAAVGCRVVTDTELDVAPDPFGWTMADPAGAIVRVALDLDDEAEGVYRMRDDRLGR